MTDILKVSDLSQLTQFLNNDSVIEIVRRAKNNKIKAFQKIVLDEFENNKEKQMMLENVMHSLNKSYEINVKNMQLLNSVAQLNQLNLLMNGLNLCETGIGFIIINEKLNDMSKKMDEVLSVVKTAKDLQLDYEFKQRVSEHSIMLNSRKLQNYFTLDKMEALVVKEHDTLEMIIKHFMSEVVNDRGVLLYSIMTLASMLSVSLRYFDEMFFLEYNEKFNNSENWHLLHKKWISIFDKLSSNEFIKKVQDYGFFELNLTTSECDAFYINVKDNALSYKQDIIDNQELLTIFRNKKVYDTFMDYTNHEIEQEISNTINQEIAFYKDDEVINMLNDSLRKVGIIQ